MASTEEVQGSITSRRLPRWVRFINGASSALMGIAALACLLMVLHVIVDVSGRTLLNRPLAGTLEISQHWYMTTIVFAGLGYAQLKRENIRATPVTELLPEQWQRRAEIGAVAIFGIFAAGLTYFGWQAALQSLDLLETARTGNTVIPIWPVLFLIPIGSAALFLQCAASAYERMTELSRTPGGLDSL